MRPRLTAVFSLHWGFCASAFAARRSRAGFQLPPLGFRVRIALLSHRSDLKQLNLFYFLMGPKARGASPGAGAAIG